MKEDGGSAFAGQKLDLEGVVWSSGMSRRQWLAGLAMQALISEMTPHMADEAIARAAYKMADEMLDCEEKEKP
jgi:hypothetical protein